MYDYMKDFYDYRAEQAAERIARFGELVLESADDADDDCDFLVLDDSTFEGGMNNGQLRLMRA